MEPDTTTFDDASLLKIFTIESPTNHQQKKWLADLERVGWLAKCAAEEGG